MGRQSPGRSGSRRGDHDELVPVSLRDRRTFSHDWRLSPSLSRQEASESGISGSCDGLVILKERQTLSHDRRPSHSRKEALTGCSRYSRLETPGSLMTGGSPNLSHDRRRLSLSRQEALTGGTTGGSLSHDRRHDRVEGPSRSPSLPHDIGCSTLESPVMCVEWSSLSPHHRCGHSLLQFMRVANRPLPKLDPCPNGLSHPESRSRHYEGGENGKSPRIFSRTSARILVGGRV